MPPPTPGTGDADADTPPGIAITPGDRVVWTYVVTNVGPVAVTDVTVDDLLPPGVTWVGPTAIEFPRALRDRPFDFSFSGLKTSVVTYLENARNSETLPPRADVAASIQEAIVDVLVEKTFNAVEETGVTAVGGGGGGWCNRHFLGLPVGGIRRPTGRFVWRVVVSQPTMVVVQQMMPGLPSEPEAPHTLVPPSPPPTEMRSMLPSVTSAASM